MIFLKKDKIERITARNKGGQLYEIREYWKDINYRFCDNSNCHEFYWHRLWNFAWISKF